MYKVKIKDPNLSMEDLLKGSSEIVQVELGSLVDGVVVAKAKNKILLDLGGSLVGVISGRELHDSLETAKSLKEGDTVSAVAVEDENDDGMVVLSIRKAGQIQAWDRFDKAHKEGQTIQVVAQEANKGGLLLDIDGIKAFIPVSQLAPLHYPRVDNADASQILAKLEALIGVKFNVKVITIDQEMNKLILSEKEAMADDRVNALANLQVGQKVEGVVSGIVKFGIFVAFEGIEGLVHISEIAWGHVKNPSEYAKVGDKVEVLVIGKDGEKISLSLKRLLPDPWLEVAKKFKIGTDVNCTVNKVTQFGAFVTLQNDINGLIHISEIAHEKVNDPRDYLTVGQKVTARVISVDLDDHRIGLSLKVLKPAPEKKEEPKAEIADAEIIEKEVPAEVKEEAKEEKKEDKTKKAAKKDEEAEVKEEEKESKTKKTSKKKEEKVEEDKEKKKTKAKKTTKKEEKEEVKEESSSAKATEDKEKKETKAKKTTKKKEDK